jgi:hypothetical protein
MGAMLLLRLVILHTSSQAFLFIFKDCPLDMQLLWSFESVVAQGIH